MFKEYLILILGIWLLILPSLGFPHNWRYRIIVVVGLILIYLAYLLYKEKKVKIIKPKNQPDTFSENSQEHLKQ